jgi:hypothetical protein
LRILGGFRASVASSQREVRRAPIRFVNAARRSVCGFTVAVLPILAAGDGHAGAWLIQPGAGQVIAGDAFSGSTRAFDAHGKLILVPAYQKFELGAYIEYAVADWLTLIASPAYDRIGQPAPAAPLSQLLASIQDASSAQWPRFGIAFDASSSDCAPKSAVRRREVR